MGVYGKTGTFSLKCFIAGLRIYRTEYGNVKRKAKKCKTFLKLLQRQCDLLITKLPL